MSLRTPDVLLGHILDATREACSFVRGLSRKDLDGDRQLQHSLVRDIEVIGEAASRIDRSFRESHPEIPWAKMVGMRNWLIHAYFDIDMDIVWKTTVEE